MKTHPLNVSYLVVGLAFIGISASWALRAADVIASADLEWILPLGLVLAGAIGLVAFVAGQASRRTASGKSEPSELSEPSEPAWLATDPAGSWTDLSGTDPATDLSTEPTDPQGDPR